MKVKIYHWYNALLSALLTMLGFGSCTELGADEYGAPPVMEGTCEYGAPYVDYVIRGNVTDEYEHPIGGVKAVVKYIPDEAPGYAFGIDSTCTDADGKFQIDTRSMANHDLKLVVEDTDGQENGGDFRSDTIRLADMEQRKLENGEGWSGGKYELKTNVKLKKKP